MSFHAVSLMAVIIRRTIQYDRMQLF